MRIFNVVLVGPANYKSVIMIGQPKAKAQDIAKKLNNDNREMLQENRMRYVVQEESN